jgi:16S rRNA processing protein RimM
LPQTEIKPETRPLAATGWVAIAALLRPQGRRGEILAEPLSSLPEIFRTGTEVVLAAKGATPVAGVASRTVEEHWFPTGKNAGRVVLKLSGCESINEAEALAGMQAMISVDALPKLDDETYFVGDLIGCAFFDGDEQAGTIVDVEFPTGPDGRTRLEDAATLLAVALTGDSAEDEPVLVPFVRAWLESVDVAGRRVVMHLPAGLLGDAEDDGSDADSDNDESGEDDESGDDAL